MIIQIDFTYRNKIAAHKKVTKQICQPKRIKELPACQSSEQQYPDRCNQRNFTKPKEITPDYPVHS